MELIFEFFLLGVGLLALWKVGEKTVLYAIGFSEIYKIESFVVGFFIFAISTGLPEIASAFISSLEKVPELSAGVLLGSTLVNMTLILGIILLITHKISVNSILSKKLLQTVALIFVIFLGLSFAKAENAFTGLLLIALYIGSAFWFQAGIPKKGVSKEVKEAKKDVEKEEKRAYFNPKIDIVLKLAICLGFLLLSSYLTVHSGTNISNMLGVDLSLIGGTIIAIGTSLPELSLEIHAVRQKDYALALGDIFGSSLLNISLILGYLLLMNPTLDLSYGKRVFPYLLPTIVWFVWRLTRKKRLNRLDGVVFLIIFSGYMVATFLLYSAG